MARKAGKKRKVFEVEKDPTKKKYYVLEMYPYPFRTITTWAICAIIPSEIPLPRFKRMNGFNVLYPMGYDSFGLPAEAAAIKLGTHPDETTRNNIATIKGQQKRLGFSYDWRREVSSIETKYYKWDQWFFIKMFEQGLAYQKKSFVNWCPSCNSVLANEQVVSGGCWRCGTHVEQKNLTQWFLKMTKYADETLR